MCLKDEFISMAETNELIEHKHEDEYYLDGDVDDMTEDLGATALTTKTEFIIARGRVVVAFPINEYVSRFNVNETETTIKLSGGITNE